MKKDVYLSTEYDLHYPSVDTITNSLRNLRTSAQMYKIDISRAFRHIKVDTRTVSRYHSDLSSSKKLQTNVAKTNCRKSVDVTVTGAGPCGASVLLQNRFQPLQMLLGDHHVKPQLEEVLQGQNNAQRYKSCECRKYTVKC